MHHDWPNLYNAVKKYMNNSVMNCQRSYMNTEGHEPARTQIFSSASKYSRKLLLLIIMFICTLHLNPVIYTCIIIYYKHTQHIIY